MEELKTKNAEDNQVPVTLFFLQLNIYQWDIIKIITGFYIFFEAFLSTT